MRLYNIGKLWISSIGRDGMDYNDQIKKLFEAKKEAKSYKAVVLTVRDAQLLTFLKEEHPAVWQEFKEWAMEKSGRVVE